MDHHHDQQKGREGILESSRYAPYFISGVGNTELRRLTNNAFDGRMTQSARMSLSRACHILVEPIREKQRRRGTMTLSSIFRSWNAYGRNCREFSHVLCGQREPSGTDEEGHPSFLFPVTMAKHHAHMRPAMTPLWDPIRMTSIRSRWK